MAMIISCEQQKPQGLPSPLHSLLLHTWTDHGGASEYYHQDPAFPCGLRGVPYTSSQAMSSRTL